MTLTSALRKFSLLLLLALVAALSLFLSTASVSAADETPTAQPAPSETPLPQPTAVPQQPAAQPTMPGNPHATGDCLSCHGIPGLTGRLPGGETMSLYIVPAEHQGSFHNQQGIGCRFCHLEQGEYPHKGTTMLSCSVCHWQTAGLSSAPELVFDMPYEDARAVMLEINTACQNCHDEMFTVMQTSAHMRVMDEGNRFAPVCVDCHSGHNIQPVDRLGVSAVCSKCHLAEYSTYKNSVHGAALEQEGNVDVPTCGGCHGTHSVIGPRSPEFRFDAAEMCGRCHTDKALMGKYGISTDVLETYLDDAHGRTDFFRQVTSNDVAKASCYDCHGVHNIRRPDDPKSRVYPENLQRTCAQCHTDANIAFPADWISHKSPEGGSMSAIYFGNLLALGLVILVVAVILFFIIMDLRRRMAGRLEIRMRREVEEEDEADEEDDEDEDEERRR